MSALPIRRRSLLAASLLGLFSLRRADGKGQLTFTLYKGYRVPVPADNYVVLDARGMLPDVYMVLDLRQKEARIYSAYQETGHLHTHRMTNQEYEQAAALLFSDRMRKIPEHGDKMAADGFEFGARGIVNGKALTFHHTLPENKAVLELYELYQHFRDAVPTP